MMVASSTELFHGQGLKDMVCSATQTAVPRDGRQRERKTCLQGFCYTRVFRGSKAVECAVLREISFMAWKVLSHKAINRKLDKQGKKRR